MKCYINLKRAFLIPLIALVTICLVDNNRIFDYFCLMKLYLSKTPQERMVVYAMTKNRDLSFWKQYYRSRLNEAIDPVEIEILKELLNASP